MFFSRERALFNLLVPTSPEESKTRSNVVFRVSNWFNVKFDETSLSPLDKVSRVAPIPPYLFQSNGITVVFCAGPLLSVFNCSLGGNLDSEYSSWHHDLFIFFYSHINETFYMKKKIFHYWKIKIDTVKWKRTDIHDNSSWLFDSCESSLIVFNPDLLLVLEASKFQLGLNMCSYIYE